jgi:hypothetical protein
MISRPAFVAVLAFAIPVSGCDVGPRTDPMAPREKHVIPATELLRDTSNLTSRVEHSTSVDFAWNKMAHIEWTTARQGRAHVISGIVVRFPLHPEHETYSAQLLRVTMPESEVGTTRMVVSLQVKRTKRWGEKGAMVSLHTDGYNVGMYRRWPWSDW